MVIKTLMAAEQTKREGKFLILFSTQNFNRSTSARLLLTIICNHNYINQYNSEALWAQ